MVAPAVYAAGDLARKDTGGKTAGATLAYGSVNRIEPKTMLAWAVEGVPAGTDQGARDR